MTDVNALAQAQHLFGQILLADLEAGMFSTGVPGMAADFNVIAYGPLDLKALKKLTQLAEQTAGVEGFYIDEDGRGVFVIRGD